MIALYIGLAVAAVALGGLLAFILIPDKKERAAVDETKRRKKPKVQPEPKPKAVKEEVKPAEPAEPVRAEEVEVTAEDVAEETDEETEEEETVERKLVVENGEVKYIVIKYSKSFQAKLIQSGEHTKSYYSGLKNRLLSYGGVKSRMSWKWETFRAGRKTLAKLRLRGKTLSVAFALSPEQFDDTKYHVESIADVKSYADTPCLYRIKNDRRLRYAKELVDRLMVENGLPAGLIEENTDYAAQYPYETTAALIERKLIKELTDEEAQSGTVFKSGDVRQSVTAAEVDRLMKDEVAEILIERAGGVSDRTKTGIVNIDALSQHFKDGEKVTLGEVKKRVAGFGKKVTYLKVLARGTLDKKLTVEADSFSLQAVKMILLTGGKVIKK